MPNLKIKPKIRRNYNYYKGIDEEKKNIIQEKNILTSSYPKGWDFQSIN